MKKYLLAGGLAAVLMLGSCGTTDDEQASENTNSEEMAQLQAENEELRAQNAELEEQLSNMQTADEESNDTAEEDTGAEDETETAESDEATRTNPLSLGESHEIEVMEYDDEGNELTGTAMITIDNVMRGQEAIDALTDEYSSPEPPENENYEWVVFEMTYELLEFEDDNRPVYVGEYANIIEEDGSAAPNMTAIFWDDSGFSSGELYSGGTASGNIALQAPEGESFLIQYDDMVNSVFYQAE